VLVEGAMFAFLAKLLLVVGPRLKSAPAVPTSRLTDHGTAGAPLPCQQERKPLFRTHRN
jgi:hypothetical protein